MRPPGLEIVRFLAAGAEGGEVGQGGGDEGAGGGGGGAGVEEGVDVGGGDVDDGAEGGGVLLEHGHGFGGGDGAGIARGGQGGFGLGDESGEAVRRAVVVEDGFVADDDHFDRAVVALGPGCDGADLFGRDGEAGRGDEDAEHEFEVVGGGGGADGAEAGAVGAVQADGGEAFGGDGGDVG